MYCSPAVPQTKTALGLTPLMLAVMTVVSAGSMTKRWELSARVSMCSLRISSSVSCVVCVCVCVRRYMYVILSTRVGFYCLYSPAVA